MSCFSTTEQEYDEKCHIYSHIYNNKIRDSNPYHNDGNFLYRVVRLNFTPEIEVFYTLRRLVIRKVLSTRIWGVPPAGGPLL